IIHDGPTLLAAVRAYLHHYGVKLRSLTNFASAVASAFSLIEGSQKNRAISPPLSSRQGRLFPPFCGNPVISFARYAATSFFDQLNSVPSIHMRCRMTASLRATATVALRSPFRLASLIPQAFNADHFGTRVSSTPAASKR